MPRKTIIHKEGEETLRFQRKKATIRVQQHFYISLGLGHCILPEPRSPCFLIYSHSLLCVQIAFNELFTKRAKRRCAFRGNKKANYYPVAAILYRVRVKPKYVFTTENTEFTEKCLKNTVPPLCSAKRLENLYGAKIVFSRKYLSQQRFYIASGQSH